MARTIRKLESRFVGTVFRKGKYGDGGGLYLQVAAGGTKSWIFRYMIRGKAREMGLGSFDTVTLKEARQAAEACRGVLEKKLDPIEERNRREREAEARRAKSKTFRECAEAFLEFQKDRWGNDKHAEQWASTLETYVYPKLGDLNVNDVDTRRVLDCIKPIWREIPTTASRVRGRIESILDWAEVLEYRDEGKNPARWEHHLAKVLPAPTEVREVRHHPAIDYRDIGLLMAKLRKIATIPALCMDFVLLTAVRVGAVVSARWKEIDMDAEIWTVPAERMKGQKGKRKPHQVPLSPGALEVLDIIRDFAYGGAVDPEDFVFPGQREGRPVSSGALSNLLVEMGFSEITNHGGRATFKTWATERTNYAKEVAEKSLAHVIDSKIEAAYQRGELLEKRRSLMADWDKHCRHLWSAELDAGNAEARRIRVM